MCHDFFCGSAILQPSNDLPSKICTNPASESAAPREKAVANAAMEPTRKLFIHEVNGCSGRESSRQIVVRRPRGSPRPALQAHSVSVGRFGGKLDSNTDHDMKN